MKLYSAEVCGQVGCELVVGPNMLYALARLGIQVVVDVV
jgi:hypothetical protein